MFMKRRRNSNILSKTDLDFSVSALKNIVRQNKHHLNRQPPAHKTADFTPRMNKDEKVGINQRLTKARASLDRALLAAKEINKENYEQQNLRKGF